MSDRIAADGGEPDGSEKPVEGNPTEQQNRWWGQPFDARRFHVFGGHGKARSLCGSWMLNHDGQDPDVDPEGDTFKDGRDCKECARKAGVLDE
jgi:hypothetical protein